MPQGVARLGFSEGTPMRHDISTTKAFEPTLANSAAPFFSSKNPLLGLMLFAYLLFSVQTPKAEEPSRTIAQEIHAIISAQQHPFLNPSHFVNRAADLDAMYQPSGYPLLWLGRAQTDKNVADALALLQDAAVNGLNKRDYGIDALQEKRQAALVSPPDAYRTLAEFDTALSLAMLRFFHDLHYGRVNPQGIQFNLKLREKKLIDLPALIVQHLEQQTLPAVVPVLEPNLRQYQQLKSALAQYRKLSENSTPFKLAFDKSVRPGDALPPATELHRLLVELGDIPEPELTATQTARYSAELVAGVKKFQARHGLSPDGVIGKSTAKELTTSLPQRVTQIELAMERLRWLPALDSGPSIIVNIPAFQLWTLENVNDANAAIGNMRVVVGKAMKNQTPVLMATMSYIDFAPYWNVPYNIVKEEIIPKLIRDPGYLDRENMELVSTAGVGGYSDGAIALLKQGAMRIRQRPGKKNALGKVKFLFPNKDDVYLHDTPSNALFGRSRRDFSHGCVRVADPTALAEFALRNQQGWDKERILRVMRAGKMQRVILKQPIPVLFFYLTAFFDQQGQLVFYSDIYGHDTVLQQALKTPEDLPDQVLFVSAPPTPLAADTLKSSPVTE